MKGWVGLVGWHVAMVYPHKWSPISCKSSTAQGKFASKRPAFYHCATQPCHTTIAIILVFQLNDVFLQWWHLPSGLGLGRPLTPRWASPIQIKIDLITILFCAAWLLHTQSCTVHYELLQELSLLANIVSVASRHTTTVLSKPSILYNVKMEWVCTV